MFRQLLRGISFAAPLLLSVVAISAQATCPELVELALQQVDANCAGIGRNEACYGYNRVEAAFFTTVADDFFAEPADMVEVADLQTIRTAPMDVDNNQWGVAVMSLQANLPNTIPGQNVTFVLLGDTEVENAVAPDAAFQPATGVDIAVAVAAGVNVRSGPGTNFNVIGAVERNGTLQADGISSDEEWLRVAYRDRPGWVSRSLIAENDALADLPVLTDELRTPMQAFYVQTGIGQPACEEAPDDILLVQGPEGIEIELTVNGANIELGSSGAFRTIEMDGRPYLEILVFDGEFVVKGDGETPDTVIRPGYHSMLCLGDGSVRLGDGSVRMGDGSVRLLNISCPPSVPEQIDTRDFGADWCSLEGIPASLLNYPLNILCPGETVIPTSAIGGATQSQLASVNCSTFSLIGPFSGITPRPTTFSWTEAPGATDYEIVFYNYQGGVAQTFLTQQTSITLNVGEIPTGSELAWEVRAYQNGVYACVTSRTPIITRLADPQAPAPATGGTTAAPAAGFTVGSFCDGTLQVNYTWANLPPGDTIYFYWTGLMPGSAGPFNTPSGSFSTSSQYTDTGPGTYVYYAPTASTIPIPGRSC